MIQEPELVFHAERKDFRIETYVGTGPGGQHRNKTKSCVRITHIESGLSSSCCKTRSQHLNKEIAFKLLAAKLVAHYVPTLERSRAPGGTLTIRTYNTVENRVKDHASGFQQSWVEVKHDMTAMIEARAKSV